MMQKESASNKVNGSHGNSVTNADNRSSKRIELSSRIIPKVILFWNNEYYVLNGLDLSLGGMKIVQIDENDDIPLSNGDTVQLHIYFNQSLTFAFDFEVRWVGGKVLGGEFQSLTTMSKMALNQYIDNYAAA